MSSKKTRSATDQKWLQEFKERFERALATTKEVRMVNIDIPGGYDVIGDIHGHGDELLALLEKMGYSHDGISYTHENRQALFLGDFVDRGDQQKLVLDTVMAMCERGSARAVMGNHEFNALAFHTEDPARPGVWLRPRTNKNIKQYIAFLNEYLASDEDLQRVLDWFMTLPLWLDMPEGLRLVHACWHEPSIENLKPLLGVDDRPNGAIF